MAFFKNNYNKPGPGVPKNAPMKKGFPRFLEIIGRDFGNLVKLNILVFFCVLPAQIFFLLMLQMTSGGTLGMFYLFGGLALVASLLVGPALAAMYHLVSRMLRDEPGFLWHNFKKIFKENARQTMIPGVIYSLIVASQVYSYIYYTSAPAGMNIFLVGTFLISVLLFIMISPYFFVQPPYLHLGVGAMLKNSFLLALGFAPQSLAGGLMGGGLVILQFMLFPLSPIVTFFIGYSIPCLLNMMWIWPKVDTSFKISATLKERRKNEIEQLESEEE